MAESTDSMNLFAWAETLPTAVMLEMLTSALRRTVAFTLEPLFALFESTTAFEFTLTTMGMMISGTLVPGAAGVPANWKVVVAFGANGPAIAFVQVIGFP